MYIILYLIAKLAQVVSTDNFLSWFTNITLGIMLRLRSFTMVSSEASVLIKIFFTLSSLNSFKPEYELAN